MAIANDNVIKLSTGETEMLKKALWDATHQDSPPAAETKQPTPEDEPKPIQDSKQPPPPII